MTTTHETDQGGRHDEPALRLEMLVTPPAIQASPGNNYERSSLLLVRSGQPIARLAPDFNLPTPAPGSPPAVELQPDPDWRPNPAAARAFLGPNTALDDAGMTIVATADGRVLTGPGISVETTLHIPGDVDFSIGNIDFGGDVAIKGAILDDFQVRCGGDLTVGKTIEACQVHARGSIHTRGGILGKEKAHCTAGGNLVTHLITNAHVEAGGDITVDKEITHSYVFCRGRLAVERGALIAGRITAIGGIVCRSAGSPSGVPLLVEPGVDREMAQLTRTVANAIVVAQHRAEQIQASLKPLFAQRRALKAKEKEQVKELLGEVAEAAARAERLAAKLKSAQAAAAGSGRAEFIFSKVVHPGVTVRFSQVQTTAVETLHGPACIMPRQSEGHWEIVMAGRTGNQFVVLPTQAARPDAEPPDTVTDK